MRKLRPVLALLVVLGLLWFWQAPSTPSSPASPAGPPPAASSERIRPDALPAFLPSEAADTLRLIHRGGPYPHRQDGTVFQNRERRLPARDRGHYREFTVATPGLSHRGARRIVTGGDPPSEFWYTDDHYQSFRRFEPPR